MLKIVQYMARISTLLVLSAVLYYFIDDTAFIQEDNRKSVEACRVEVEGGCPLLLQALEARTVEVHLLEEKIKQLELDISILSSCPITMPTEK